jgi:hypothetical protein
MSRPGRNDRLGVDLGRERAQVLRDRLAARDDRGGRLTPVDCIGDGRTLRCDPPGDDTAPFEVPQPRGFPNYIGPRRRDHHSYRAETSTPDHNGSYAEAINEQLTRHPTPGRNNRPAAPRGTRNDAGINPAATTGEWGDQVLSYTTTDTRGNRVVVNVTAPDNHLLDPGIVAQYTIPERRRTRVIAVGEGNAPLSVPANPLARHTFQQKIESDVRAAIAEQTRQDVERALRRRR